MRELVRLRMRPSRDGKSFVYFLDYMDENGKQQRISLGHADKRKAEREQAHRERQLRMGVIAPCSMRLNEFVEDSLRRTGNQIRESTQIEYRSIMEHFIEVVGDIDYSCVKQEHGELFIRASLDRGDSAGTTAKKIRHLKRLFQLAVEREQLEANPFRHLRQPKVPKKKVRVYSVDECERILRSARKNQNEDILQWDLLITTALITGM